MHRHWREFGPPVHISVAGFLGVTKPKKRAEPEGDFAADMATLFPGGAG